MKILIPTYKPAREVQDLLDDIHQSQPNCDVYASCVKQSASANRNLCLDKLELNEIAVMLDDDITGFYPGWVEDLTSPLLEISNCVMVSARLMKPDGTPGITCSGAHKLTTDTQIVDRFRHCTLPTAAIAFVNKGHRFDENFRGSGWEDNDWCLKYREADSEAVFVQSNKCKLIHLNEMKEQKGANWHWNKNYFHSRWPKLPEQV